MQINFKYISTRSGKSLILNIEDKRYVFNIFEGFQRYAIEQGISLKGIDTVFLPTSSSIPPFLGYSLTVRDMQKTSLNIICNENIAEIVKKSDNICPKKHLVINFKDCYEDKFIKVVPFNLNVQNYIIEFKSISGKLLVEKIPKHLPKTFYSSLKMGEDVCYGNIKYNGKDFIEPPVEIGKVLLLFGELENNYHSEDFNMILCFNPIEYNRINKIYKNTYLMGLNDKVEYESHYKIQQELNKLDSNYLLPISNTIKEISLIKVDLLGEKNDKRPKKEHKIINSGDEIVYDTTIKGFKFTRSKLLSFSTNKNRVPNNSLVFLGTGCALPSKYRNVSSVLYNIDGNLILFDCGEDTIGQLERIYGTDNFLSKIKYIFISHSHADHCLGIFNLLQKLNHKIVVIGPVALMDLFGSKSVENITFYNTTPAKELETFFYKDFRISNGDFSIFKSKIYKEKSLINEEIDQYIIEIENGDFKFLVCGVEHTQDSCSVSLIYKNTKISYSGDTRPSPLFTIMAANSNVMIHESTFSGGTLDKAIKTKHSTIKEANDVFVLSKSKALLLTHFSQRYPKGFINRCEGIPCMDFYMYVVGKTKYKKGKINEYLKTLEIK